MQQRQPFNQLPSLRQSLSDSSLRSNESGPSVHDPSSSTSNINHHHNNVNSNTSSRRHDYNSSYPYHSDSGGRAHSGSVSSSEQAPHLRQHQHHQQQHRYPSLTLPLPAAAAFGAEHHSHQSHQRAHANDPQHSSYATALAPAANPSASSSPSTSFIAGSSPPHHSRSSSSRSQQSDDRMYSNYAQQYPAQQLPSNVPYGAFHQQQQQQQPGRMLPSAHSSMLPPVYSQQNAYAAPNLPAPLPFDNSVAQQIPTPASTTHPLAMSTMAALSAETSFQGTRDNYKFELRVEQQPQRARMCGFGDKDRRPITPPPCVRLIVRRIDTDEEVDVDRLDGAFFVLQVNLWDGDGAREVNVIRASSSAPTQSISTAVQMGYPPPNSNMYVDTMGYSVGQFGMPNYGMPQPVPQQNPHAMYTRNLIGSLAVNASLLKDTEGNPGYWFVLSDLSVRTEGWFRLRLDFIDVGTHGANPGEATLNRRRCPVLASVFSDKFQVYSAKKFPGVIESTPLSKCFAHQGIKIPIRKDGKGDKNDDDDDDYKRS